MFISNFQCVKKKDRSNHWELAITTLIAIVFTGSVLLAFIYGFGFLDCPFGKYSNDHMCLNCNIPLSPLCADCVSASQCT